MNTFYSITGAVVIILIALAALASAVAWAYSEINQTRWDRWMEKRKRAAHEIGQEIASDSHWFSEHAPTVALLQAIGREYLNYGGFEVRRIREEWQKTLPKPEDPEAGIEAKIEIVAQWLNAWNKPRTSHPESNLDFSSLSDHAKDVYRAEAAALLKAIPRKK